MAERGTISDLLADYGWANDTRDIGLLSSLMTEEVTFTVTVAGVDDPIGPFVGRDAVVEFIGSSLRAQTDQRRHVMTNRRVWREDGFDRVRCYLSLHVTDRGALTVMATGIYGAEVVDVDGALRIRALTLDMDGAF